MLGLGWTYIQGGTYSCREVCVRFRLTHRGTLIRGGKFVLGLGWTYTQRGTYSWREVCVRFRMDLHTQWCTYSWTGREVCVWFRMDLLTRALIYVGRFVLSLGLIYTQKGALIHGGKFVLGLGCMDLHTEGGHLFMEGSLC